MATCGDAATTPPTHQPPHQRRYQEQQDHTRRDQHRERNCEPGIRGVVLINLRGLRILRHFLRLRDLRGFRRLRGFRSFRRRFGFSRRLLRGLRRFRGLLGRGLPGRLPLRGDVHATGTTGCRLEGDPADAVDEDLRPGVQLPGLHVRRPVSIGPGRVAHRHAGGDPQLTGHDGEGRGVVHAEPGPLGQQGLHDRVRRVRIRTGVVGDRVVVAETAGAEPVLQRVPGLDPVRRSPGRLGRRIAQRRRHLSRKFQVGRLVDRSGVHTGRRQGTQVHIAETAGDQRHRLDGVQVTVAGHGRRRFRGRGVRHPGPLVRREVAPVLRPLLRGHHPVRRLRQRQPLTTQPVHRHGRRLQPLRRLFRPGFIEGDGSVLPRVLPRGPASAVEVGESGQREVVGTRGPGLEAEDPGSAALLQVLGQGDGDVRHGAVHRGLHHRRVPDAVGRIRHRGDDAHRDDAGQRRHRQSRQRDPGRGGPGQQHQQDAGRDDTRPVDDHTRRRDRGEQQQ